MAVPGYEVLRDKITKHDSFPERLLALDPGGTTGVSIFRNGSLPGPKQMTQVEGTISRIIALFDQVNPDLVVAEDFILYGHKANDLKWDSLRESRLLGAIEALCWQRRIPLILYTASRGKRFANDDKLRSWGLKVTHANRHQIDSVRHGVEYLLFGEKGESVIPRSWWSKGNDVPS